LLAMQRPEASTSAQQHTTPEDKLTNKLANLQTSPPVEPEDEDDAIVKVPGLAPEDEEDKLSVLQSDPTSPLYSVRSFEELNLKPELLKGVFAMNFSKPSKIQEAALPVILNDPPQNLIAQAQSGTGKTAAFTLGMLSRIDSTRKVPQALCICPTRELARQLFDVIGKLGKFTDIVPFLAVRDVASVRGILPNQIVVGTPGKITDLIKKRSIDLRNIKVFVLDEADEMLEQQGLGDQTLRIQKQLPRGCQILLFSATYAEKVAEFAKKVVPRPFVSITLERKQLSLEKIAQFYIDCGSEERKFDILSELYCYLSVGQSIIFVHRRETARNLAKRMNEDGHTVSLLEGSMDPQLRDQIIDEFRQGRTKVLIATNVIARGIDILQVSMVINYDLPLDRMNKPDFSTYLHRIGRSGRFGRSGIAVNLVCDERSRRDLKAIEDYFGKEIIAFPPENIPKFAEMLERMNQ
jgi:ATP-dependent RNA helicase DDX19/DBP5